VFILPALGGVDDEFLVESFDHLLSQGFGPVIPYAPREPCQSNHSGHREVNGPDIII
jgi:hypothetical protein